MPPAPSSNWAALRQRLRGGGPAVAGAGGETVADGAGGRKKKVKSKPTRGKADAGRAGRNTQLKGHTGREAHPGAVGGSRPAGGSLAQRPTLKKPCTVGRKAGDGGSAGTVEGDRPGFRPGGAGRKRRQAADGENEAGSRSVPAVAGEGKRSKKKRKLRVLEGGRGGVGEGRRPPAEGTGGTGGQGQGQGKTAPPQGFPAGPPGRSASGPPAPFPHPTRMAVLTPASPAFAAARAACYAGFEHDGADAFPEALHAETERALAAMSAAGLFHYDIVSAGKAVSSTFCERTLLGNAGMTYHYQRLRIFAYPWGQHTEPGSPFRALRRLNEAMVVRTNTLLDQQSGLIHRGRADYNITLINKMAAPADCAVPLKDEALYGMGPTSVSWHADSSLEDWSSIAVWQTTDNAPDATDWHVAVRVAHDEATPALRVPLRTRETYYMLGDFNHHHHHAVLAGASDRYSSTHRVAVTGRDTWGYIKARCQAALGVVAAAGGPVVAADGLRAVGEALLEVELQWLRMFWMQGARHADSHDAFWLPRMHKLRRWWGQLEDSRQRSLQAPPPPPPPPPYFVFPVPTYLLAHHVHAYSIWILDIFVEYWFS
eukprot:jgi/Tetstr1/459932/TSEL_005271.t1